MGILIALIIGLLMGLTLVVMLLGAGFSGSLGVTVGIILFLGGAGFLYGWLASRKYPSSFWLYGFIYIAPALSFISGAAENRAADTMKMRLAWLSVLALFYLTTLIGGLKGRRS